MCLSINTRIHKVNRSAGNPTVHPVITDQPLQVWKRLIPEWLGDKYYSPYRRDTYVLGAKKNAPKGYLGVGSVREPLGSFDRKYRTRWTVEHGIHAYFAPDRAHARRYASFCGDYEIFPAVIPAGSKIFIGKNHDVVSTALIVYKDMETLLAGYQPGEAKPVDSNSLRPITV